MIPPYMSNSIAKNIFYHIVDSVCRFLKFGSPNKPRTHAESVEINIREFKFPRFNLNLDSLETFLRYSRWTNCLHR